MIFLFGFVYSNNNKYSFLLFFFNVTGISEKGYEFNSLVESMQWEKIIRKFLDMKNRIELRSGQSFWQDTSKRQKESKISWGTWTMRISTPLWAYSYTFGIDFSLALLNWFPWKKDRHVHQDLQLTCIYGCHESKIKFWHFPAHWFLPMLRIHTFSHRPPSYLNQVCFQF